MTKTKIGSTVQESDSSVELASVSVGMSLPYPSLTQVWASTRVSVHAKIRIRVPSTGFTPPLTRIP